MKKQSDLVNGNLKHYDDSYVKEIVAKFGGIKPMQLAMHHPNHTTITGWLKRETIPEKQRPAVLWASQQVNAQVVPEDFIQDLITVYESVKNKSAPRRGKKK